MQDLEIASLGCLVTRHVRTPAVVFRKISSIWTCFRLHSRIALGEHLNTVAIILCSRHFDGLKHNILVRPIQLWRSDKRILSFGGQDRNPGQFCLGEIHSPPNKLQRHGAPSGLQIDGIPFD